MAEKCHNEIELRVILELGGGRSAKLELRKDDEPMAVAEALCDKEGLPQQIVPHLAKEIQLRVAEVRSKQKQKQPTPTKTKRNRPTLSQTQSDEAFSRLYQQGLEARKKANQNREEAFEEKRQEELEVCTFQPKISNYAKRIAGGRTKGAGLDMEVKRFHEARVIREHLQQEKEKVEVETQCSFKPKITRRSEELASKKKAQARRSSLFEELYREANEMKTRKEGRLKANNAANSRKCKLGLSDEKELVQRLATPKADPDELYAEVRKLDLTNGRELFKPTIGRSPQGGTERPQNMSTTDYLFYSRHRIQDTREHLRKEEEDRQRKQLEAGFMSAASKEIAEKVRAGKFSVVWHSFNDSNLQLCPHEHNHEDCNEESNLKCLVELLPEMILRHVGPETVLTAVRTSGSEDDFVNFMLKACRKIPYTSELLL